MSNKLRNIRRIYHELMGSKSFVFEGVTVATGKTDIPKSVRRMIFKKTYESHEIALAKKVLKPDSLVLEIGCGIGVVSLICRKICSKGAVRSYEANPRMEAVIRKNYALNNLEPDLIMKAMTSTGENIEFYMDDNIISSSAIDRDRDAEKTVIESDKLDDVIADFKPTSLVVDVEGAEISLLGDSKLEGVSSIILEIHPHIVGKEAIDAMIEKLAQKGFAVSHSQHKVVLLERS